MKKFILHTFILVLLLVFFPVAWVLAGKPFYNCEAFKGKILVQQDHYKLAKFEPPKGTYLGAYVLQDTLVKGDMSSFMEVTGKKHASFFRYVAYGSPAPVAWIEECNNLGVVPHIAWEPNQGLDKVKDDAYLRKFARDLNAAGSPVFMRFASEMNGTWTAYSGNPQQYIEKWRLVHNVMAEEAPQVIMVWTVFTFPQKTILSFYPGDAYVDWVGVNIYSVVYHNNNRFERADHEDPLELLDYVYNTFSKRKPIQISEFGATHYTVTDQKYYIDFAVQKISRMYTGLKEKYPRVKSIFYFDVNNLVNAPEGRRINNYALTDNEVILKCYMELTADAHFLVDVEENREGMLNPEWFTIAHKSFLRNGCTYIATDTIQEYFQATVSKDKKGVTIHKGDCRIYLPLKENVIMVNGVKHKNTATPVVSNSTIYLPLKPVAVQLGYNVNWDKSQGTIIINKQNS
jgi:hypothetical protein